MPASISSKRIRQQHHYLAAEKRRGDVSDDDRRFAMRGSSAVDASVARGCVSRCWSDTLDDEKTSSEPTTGVNAGLSSTMGRYGDTRPAPMSARVDATLSSRCVSKERPPAWVWRSLRCTLSSFCWDLEGSCRRTRKVHWCNAFSIRQRVLMIESCSKVARSPSCGDNCDDSLADYG